MEKNSQTEQSNKLIFLGLALFLIGLTVGLFVQNMKNPRMALSAHLEGMMNGMFLILLGLIWQRLVLSATQLRVTFFLAIYGTFTNLIAVIMAALTGFGKMMPIAGGQEGTGITEGMISFLLISLALCMLAVCTLVMMGFYKHMKKTTHQILYILLIESLLTATACTDSSDNKEKQTIATVIYPLIMTQTTNSKWVIQ